MDSAIQVPVIDLSQLQNDAVSKPLLIKQIQQACTNPGIFHVINHGIPEDVIEEAMDANRRFFELPLEKKEKYISDELLKPVRFNPDQGGDRGFSRAFLKLYTNPLEEFVSLWPENPPDYREKMGRLATEMKKLGISILEPILETLNLDTSYLKHKNIEQGTHMIAINSYPPCLPESSNGLNPNKLIGAVPHTDHDFATVLLQALPALQVMNRETGRYEDVPTPKGSVQILVADHLEVMSNGKYKSVWHRVVHTCEQSRLSIAGFQSLGLDQVLEPADELVDEGNPRKYKGYSLRDYLNHLNFGIPSPFIEKIKCNNVKN